MTDLDLQQHIIRELREMAKHHGLKKLNDEDWKDYNIYCQDKPYKNDEEDEDQEDYIIVMLDDEDTDANGDWIVTVHVIFSICLYDVQNQGNIILANLMNQLDQHLRKKRIIEGKYEMMDERHKRFNNECYPNYYECDYISKWKISDSVQEGVEAFL